MLKFSLVAGLALFSSLALYAQDVRGTFSGTVTDPSGAAVPKVKITATETHTGSKTDAVSTDSGALYDSIPGAGHIRYFGSGGGIQTIYTQRVDA